MLEERADVLTINEVAKILSVSTQTLRRWDSTGILVAFRVNETQPRRYHKKDVVSFLQSRPNQD